MSLKSAIVIYRVEGVSGLKTLTGIKSYLLGQDNLVAFLQRHDRLLPIGGPAGLLGALAAGLAMDIQGVDLYHFDLKQLLHRLADLGFVGAAVRHERVLIELFALARALLSQARGLDNFKSVHRSINPSGVPRLFQR